MTKLFYLSEVIKFAIEKEQESIDLYSKLEEQVTKAEAKNIFKRLVIEERKHKAFYSKMLEGVKSEQSPGVTEGTDYDAYMLYMIDSSRHAKPFPEDIKDIATVFDYAIAREQDSILFYTGLKNYISSDDFQQIDVIIKEEEKHASILIEIRKDPDFIQIIGL